MCVDKDGRNLRVFDAKEFRIYIYIVIVYIYGATAAIEASSVEGVV